ncbi:glycan-binding surface protein [Puia sp. P3]|uniref:glycan-binding surface protein n=1 Tax=Puia sp. P3 TaxID=3423952 RepID=UPI003D6704BC
MKNIFCCRPIITVLLVAGLLPACKKNAGSPPVVTAVRNYVASPNDTVFTSLVANGQWVVLTGQNLQNPLRIEFDGVVAGFNAALVAPGSAVVQIPAILFASVDTTKLYTVRYTTAAGSTTFPFKLGPAAPTIAAISNVFANPGDSVFITGTNLVLVQQFSYAGTAITSFHSSADGTSLGFVMPAQVPGDQVVVTTRSGTVNFKIEATPTITGVSNENANVGDSVYVFGTYLKNIQTLSFAGADVPSFVSAGDGSWVGFVVPALSGSGPVSVVTKFGTTATFYNVNDIATGALSNWEWGGVFNWQWWGGASLTSGNPDFPGNSSQYMVLKTGILSGGEGNTYSSYAILLNAAQWVPAGHLSDPVANWAFKFEVSIPTGWNGGSIDIQSSLGTYVARWEPWQVSSTKTAAYSTHGWTTVTIPFTMFRTKDATLGDGKGVSMASFADLLGASGNSACTMYIHNYGSASTATGFYAAFDNLRVVQIK